MKVGRRAFLASSALAAVPWPTVARVSIQAQARQPWADIIAAVQRLIWALHGIPS